VQKSGEIFSYSVVGSCNETLCLNGGYCPDTGTGCTCSEEWTGSECDTGINFQNIKIALNLL